MLRGFVLCSLIIIIQNQWNTRSFKATHLYAKPGWNLQKNQAKAKQHPEAELCYVKINCFPHPRYSSKIKGDILKNAQKPITSVWMRLYDLLQWKWGWKWKIDHLDTN